MKKYSLSFILAILFFGSAAICAAQTPRIISLKDGSVLKGKILQLRDGKYTIETFDLGRLTIPESNILSITSLTQRDSSSQATIPSQQMQLKNQVQGLQGSILSNPTLMLEIQDLLNDTEIQSMLSDPTLLEDILSYDQDRIERNDSVQTLMQNPKMLELMQKIHKKIPAQQ